MKGAVTPWSSKAPRPARPRGRRPGGPEHRSAEAGHGGLLTRDQRQALAILARQAFQTLTRHHAVDQDFQTWRHAESIRACGLRITEARNRDFLALKTHFLNLAGRSGEAFNAALKSQTEAHGWALATLMRECTAAGVSLDYPRAIARDKYKTTHLDELGDKQLWHLIFSVRRRGQKNRAQKTGGQSAATVAGAALGAILARAQDKREAA
jgi:hypothetical protein